MAYISTCVNPTFYFFNLFLRRGGHCNHVVGLLFTLNHWFLLRLKEIPADKTCTSLPQLWHRPRGACIQPEPAMSCCFVQPSTDQDGQRKKNHLSHVSSMMLGQNLSGLKDGSERSFCGCVNKRNQNIKNLHVLTC